MHFRARVYLKERRQIKKKNKPINYLLFAVWIAFILLVNDDRVFDVLHDNVTEAYI